MHFFNFIMDRFRLSLGLVAALAIALLCNVYLVILIWSNAGQNQQVMTDVGSIHVGELFQSNLASIKIVNYSLNVESLTLMLNPDRYLAIRKPEKSVISLKNSIKRLLKSRGELTENLLASIEKVRCLLNNIFCS